MFDRKSAADMRLALAVEKYLYLNNISEMRKSK